MEDHNLLETIKERFFNNIPMDDIGVDVAIIEFNDYINNSFGGMINRYRKAFCLKECDLLGFFEKDKKEYFVYTSNVFNHNRKRIKEWKDGMNLLFEKFKTRGIDIMSKGKVIYATNIYTFDNTKIDPECKCKHCRNYV